MSDAEGVLGVAVRALRVSKRMTREMLAERANVSLGAVRNLETGSGSSIATLVRVVHALDADEWLTSLTPPPTPFSPFDVLAEVNAPANPRPRVRRQARPGPT